LGNEYELLEINGNIALGMPHDDLISTLKVGVILVCWECHSGDNRRTGPPASCI
jgi:hypothetical protein